MNHSELSLVSFIKMAPFRSPRRTMAKEAVVDKQLIILAALVLMTIIFISVGMYYTAHVGLLNEASKIDTSGFEEAFQSKTHVLTESDFRYYNQTAINEFNKWVKDKIKNDPEDKYSTVANIGGGNYQWEINDYLQKSSQNAEMTVGVGAQQIGWYDDGKMELWRTAMKWGNWALCASSVQFNRRDTYEYMQELARDFQGKVIIAKDRNSFTVDWHQSLGSKPCHDPRYVSQDLIGDLNMVYEAQCSCTGRGLAGAYTKNMTWPRMLRHDVVVFKEGSKMGSKDIFATCGVRIYTNRLRREELSLTEDLQHWSVGSKQMKYLMKPMKNEHFDKEVDAERTIHMRKSRCALKTTFSLDPKRLKTKGLTPNQRRTQEPVNFHEDDRLVMKLPSSVFYDEENPKLVKDISFHYVFKKDYYFFENAGLLTFANIAIKEIVAKIQDANVKRPVPILELGAADGWFGIACNAVVPEATLTFTDIKMKFMDDLKRAWKENNFDENKATFVEGDLFNPLVNLKDKTGKTKKYDFIWFYPPQRLEMESIYGEVDKETIDNFNVAKIRVNENSQADDQEDREKVTTKNHFLYNMQKKQWEAPQWNDEPMESYIVDGPDNIDMFRRFEKMYEKYLNPGGTVFLVVDDINVPKLYKLFLSSSRARGRTMRRWYVPNSKEAFVAVTDEREYSAENYSP